MRWLLCLPLALSSAPCADAQTRTAPATGLARIEQAYADFNDAYGAISLMDSDPARYARQHYGGRSRAAWQALYRARRTELLQSLQSGDVAAASAADARALGLMRAALAESAATPRSLAPSGRCRDAPRRDLKLEALQAALYGCFAELANELKFENARVTRVAAFELLTRLAGC